MTETLKETLKSITLLNDVMLEKHCVTNVTELIRQIPDVTVIVSTSRSEFNVRDLNIPTFTNPIVHPVNGVSYRQRCTLERHSRRYPKTGFPRRRS